MPFVEITKGICALVICPGFRTSQQLQSLSQFILHFNFFDALHYLVDLLLVGLQDLFRQLQLLVLLDMREKSGVDKVVFLLRTAPIQIDGHAIAKPEDLSQLLPRFFSIGIVDDSEQFSFEFFQLFCMFFDIIIDIVNSD